MSSVLLTEQVPLLRHCQGKLQTSGIRNCRGRISWVRAAILVGSIQRLYCILHGRGSHLLYCM